MAGIFNFFVFFDQICHFWGSEWLPEWLPGASRPSFDGCEHGFWGSGGLLGGPPRAEKPRFFADVFFPRRSQKPVPNQNMREFRVFLGCQEGLLEGGPTWRLVAARGTPGGGVPPYDLVLPSP